MYISPIAKTIQKTFSIPQNKVTTNTIGTIVWLRDDDGLFYYWGHFITAIDSAISFILLSVSGETVRSQIRFCTAVY